MFEKEGVSKGSFKKGGAFNVGDAAAGEFDRSLAQYHPISLEEMGDAALMRRLDTKFVIRETALGQLLKAVRQDYHMLEIEGLRSHAYASLYFDTPKHKFYTDHHNRKLRRSKVRMRKYLDSDLSFLEIKQKDPKGQTSKNRILIPDLHQGLLIQHKAFVSNILEQDLELLPTISNSFDRITLVHKTRKERVTIDRNIQFHHGHLSKKLAQVSVVEIKQERVNRDTAMYKTLRMNNYRPMRISKYCIGMVSMHPGIKYNRFKQKMIHLNKIN